MLRTVQKIPRSGGRRKPSKIKHHDIAKKIGNALRCCNAQLLHVTRFPCSVGVVGMRVVGAWLEGDRQTVVVTTAGWIQPDNSSSSNTLK